MKKPFIIVIAILLLVGGVAFMTFRHSYSEEFTQRKETVSYETKDGVRVTADLYITENTKAPFIILFHQASYSRGEYLSIAPELNKLGYNCMAVDQRSGSAFNGIKNETHASAMSLKKPTAYTDAYPDMEASLDYVKNTFNPETLLIWGSSYSAALSFVLYSNHEKDIDGVIAFSPGEYFKYNEKTIAEHAKTMTCPVFISSAKSEAIEWRDISETIPSDKSVFFIPLESGVHGSSALLEKTKNNQEYWTALKDFLNMYF